MFSSSFSHLVRDTLILITSLQSFYLSHIVRQGNVVAHALIQKAKLSFPLLVWMESVLLDMDDFVSMDSSVSQ